MGPGLEHIEQPPVTSFWRMFRFWSDGAVDTTVFSLLDYPRTPACDPAVVCGPVPVIPGSCPADIVRNGDVDVLDFLTVLNAWGPCK